MAEIALGYMSQQCITTYSKCTVDLRKPQLISVPLHHASGKTIYALWLTDDFRITDNFSLLQLQGKSNIVDSLLSLYMRRRCKQHNNYSGKICTHENTPYIALTGELRVFSASYTKKNYYDISRAHCIGLLWHCINEVKKLNQSCWCHETLCNFDKHG